MLSLSQLSWYSRSRHRCRRQREGSRVVAIVGYEAPPERNEDASSLFSPTRN
jgi:hypothetical protein